jgi:hypothetical protein
MFRLLSAITVASGLLLVGCADQATMDKTVAAQKAQDEKIEALTKRVEAIEQRPPEHHYELRNEGSRTFRFNPATGDSCIKLASKADWKDPETIRQGCQYQDFMNDPLHQGDDMMARTKVAECIFVGKCK